MPEIRRKFDRSSVTGLSGSCRNRETDRPGGAAPRDQRGTLGNWVVRAREAGAVGALSKDEREELNKLSAEDRRAPDGNVMST